LRKGVNPKKSFLCMQFGCTAALMITENSKLFCKIARISNLQLFAKG
jgi:hypothetical protein